MTIGIVYADITNGALGNTKQASSFGLPGAGTTSAYMRCQFGVKITVEDDLSTYCAINGGELVQDDIRGNTFPAFLWCFGHTWDVTISNDNKDEWMSKAECFQRFELSKSDPLPSRLQYSFGVDGGRGSYIGKLDNFDWTSETEGVGYVWVGGSAIYDTESITNPIWVVGQKVAVPGLRDLLKYYPFAIRKGGAFASCNRPGGATRIMKSNVWRDCKNTPSDDVSKSTVFIRKSGNWVRAPKF